MASQSEWVLTVHPASESEPCEVCAMLGAVADAQPDPSTQIVDLMVATLSARVRDNREVTLCERDAAPIIECLRRIGAVRLDVRTCERCGHAEDDHRWRGEHYLRGACHASDCICPAMQGPQSHLVGLFD